jgi:hypothetical protein
VTPAQVVLLLRAARWGIFGAILGAALSVYLAVTGHEPRGLAGVLGTDLPLAGAGLGAGLRLWVPVWFGKGWQR